MSQYDGQYFIRLQLISLSVSLIFGTTGQDLGQLLVFQDSPKLWTPALATYLHPLFALFLAVV